jgi:serine/threonine-protein kinase HipA
VTTALNAWMNGELVGTWTVDRASHTFTYAASWIASPKVRSLSLSLPVTASREVRGDVVANYFDNLLPDNDRIRQRLGRRFGTRGSDAFSLLEAIGRDCVGAVQLLPQGTEPVGWDRVDCEPLSERQIEGILRAVPAHVGPGAPLQDDDLLRISIAGAQEKTAFTRYQGRWCRPHGATPTTHIFKLPIGAGGPVGGSRRVDLSDSVPNEWLCAQIVAELGLPVASTTMARFGDADVLVVERFDRAWMDGGTWIARLPQEDFCQALGVPPRRKYEADGGPGMAKCLQLLAGSADPQQDRLAFQLAQLAYWLMAATDGHAKNGSIFLQPGDNYVMTPLYDILSMWPYFGTGPDRLNRRQAGLAMAMRAGNAHYRLETIQPRHWHQLAMKHGGPAVWQAMQALVERVEPALAAVEPRLPQGFPGRTWEAIAAGMRAEARRFVAGAPQA